MKWESAAALVAAALVTAACADSKPAASPATTAPAATSAPATTAPAATTTVASSEFGVPECDEYMTKWTACVDSKVPSDVRGQVKAAMDATKASWKQAAASPQGKAALAQMCTQSLATAKQALAPYNCTW